MNKNTRRRTCNLKKRYVYFGGLFADTKTMEFVNPDKSRRPLTQKEKKVVTKAIKCPRNNNANSKS